MCGRVRVRVRVSVRTPYGERVKRCQSCQSSQSGQSSQSVRVREGESVQEGYFILVKDIYCQSLTGSLCVSELMSDFLWLPNALNRPSLTL